MVELNHLADTQGSFDHDLPRIAPMLSHEKDLDGCSGRSLSPRQSCFQYLCVVDDQQVSRIEEMGEIENVMVFESASLSSEDQ